MKANAEDAPRYLRALQFQKNREAAQKAYAEVFKNGNRESALLAASQLGTDYLKNLPGSDQRLDQLVGDVRGKPEFVQLCARLRLRGFGPELLAFIIANPDADESVTAARLLLDDRNALYRVLRGPSQDKCSAVANALAKTGDRNATRLLASELRGAQVANNTKRTIVNALLLSGQGGRELIELAKRNQLDKLLKPIAALGLARSPDRRLREEAAKLLPAPKAEGSDNLPPIVELAKLDGDPKKGETIYTKGGCVACHRVNGKHIDFGPDLTEIGKKLSKEAMFESILFPSAAISHGFHGVTIKTNKGAPVAGYITSETDDFVTIRLPGGVSQKIAQQDIGTREDMPQSLMPPGLAGALKQDELADLVAYLMSLK